MKSLDRRPETCISNLELDRLLLGELAGSEVALRIEAHLAGCPACAKRLALLKEDATRFPEEVWVEGLVQRTRGRAPRRVMRWAAGFGALAAAAVLALWVGPAPQLRSKGASLSLEVFAKRATGAVDQVLGGAALSPGDAIRFQLGSDRAGYLVVLGLDSRPAVTAYVSADGAGIALAAGSKQQLPGSVILDETLGAERLVAVRCAERRTVDELVHAAERALAAAGGDPHRVGALGLPCTEATVLIEKQPRSRDPRSSAP